jgi:hypothetical protein
MTLVREPRTTALLVALHRLVEAGPESRRAVGVAEALGREPEPPGVLFLTGIPMENRVPEFRSLVRYLQIQAHPAGLDLGQQHRVARYGVELVQRGSALAHPSRCSRENLLERVRSA